jgi:aerobic-type carbon monoxide dehydrogenase small subunit (CoxS/CutS family)
MRKTVFRSGQATEVTADAATTLLEVVRGPLRVRSAVFGCRDRSCGACRVLVDGDLVAACGVLWRDLPETVSLEVAEDLAAEPDAARALAAFEEERPTRCKLCVGGLAVTATWLARRSEAREVDAVDAVLEQATCMCTGRGSLRRALLR